MHAQVNSAQSVESSVPFGGYKQSGQGRELGQYALDTYVFSFLNDPLTEIGIGIPKSKEFTSV